MKLPHKELHHPLCRAGDIADGDLKLYELPQIDHFIDVDSR
jgi:hypothetical protein